MVALILKIVIFKYMIETLHVIHVDSVSTVHNIPSIRTVCDIFLVYCILQRN